MARGRRQSAARRGGFMSPPASALALWTLFGVLVAALAAAALLLLFARLGVRQHAYEDAPQSHRSKTGTPTMGGIVFVVVLFAALAISRAPLLPELVFFVGL